MKLIEGEIRPIGFPMVRGIKEAPLRSEIEELAQSINGQAFLDNHELPNPNEAEVASFAIQRITGPFKAPNNNGFGSQWNEITAKAAFRSLGLSHVNSREMIRCLGQDGPQANKIKARQAEIAALLEKKIELKAQEHQEKFRLEAAKAAWIKEKFSLVDQFLSQFPALPKETKREIKKKAIATLIGFSHKFGDQTFDRFNFLQMVTGSLATGKPIEIIDIHCPPFEHSSRGIEVIPSAADQLRKNTEGKTVIISQGDVLEEIRETVQILEVNGVTTKIIIAVVDIDEFVLGDQTRQLNQFCHSLSEQISAKQLKAEIIPVSQLVGVRDLEAPSTSKIRGEWQKRWAATERTAVRMVNSEFERLQKTTLPPQMKTQEFAVWMAGRRFMVHFLLGQKLPAIFPQGIIMLRARSSEASAVDKLGAKSVGKKAFIIHHWRDRKIID
jgi:hypothetical protein